MRIFDYFDKRSNEEIAEIFNKGSLLEMKAVLDYCENKNKIAYDKWIFSESNCARLSIERLLEMISNMKEVRFSVTWDLDSDDDCCPKSEIIRMIDFTGIDIRNQEETVEFLSEWLSKEFGFSHLGFTYEIIG